MSLSGVLCPFRYIVDRAQWRHCSDTEATALTPQNTVACVTVTVCDCARQVLSSIKTVRCQCMGATGACTMRYCYVTQATHELYVTRVLQLYDEAVQVEMQGQVQVQAPPQQSVLQDAPFGASAPAPAGAAQERRQRAGASISRGFGARRAQQQRRTPQASPQQWRQQPVGRPVARAEVASQVQPSPSKRRVRRGLGSAPVLVVARSASSSTGAGGEAREPLPHELVYHKPSPDFCERNDARFVPGTAGRECNKTSSAQDSCELICCGRGYSTRREKVTLECNCQFSFAESSMSYVCSKCQEIKEFYNCN